MAPLFVLAHAGSFAFVLDKAPPIHESILFRFTPSSFCDLDFFWALTLCQLCPWYQWRTRLLSQGPCFNLVGKTEVCNLVEDVCGDGYGNPLHYSCLENPMDRGAWWATVRRVPQSQRRLKQLSMHACKGCIIGKKKSDSILDLFLWPEPCIPSLLLQMNIAWNNHYSPFSRLWLLKV